MKKTQWLTTLLLTALGAFCVIVAYWQSQIITQQHQSLSQTADKVIPTITLADNTSVDDDIESVPEPVVEQADEEEQIIVTVETTPENPTATEITAVIATATEEIEITAETASLPEPDLTEPDTPQQTEIEEQNQQDTIVVATEEETTTPATPIETNEVEITEPTTEAEIVKPEPEPQPEPEPEPSIMLQQEIDLIFEHNKIQFDFNSANLTKDSQNLLDDLVKLLKQQPEAQIEIGGHSDTRGNAKFNQQLSQQRANAILRYMVNHGMSKKRLIAVGYGSSKPLIKKAKTQAQHQLNRRITFTHHKEN